MIVTTLDRKLQPQEMTKDIFLEINNHISSNKLHKIENMNVGKYGVSIYLTLNFESMYISTKTEGIIESAVYRKKAIEVLNLYENTSKINYKEIENKITITIDESTLQKKDLIVLQKCNDIIFEKMHNLKRRLEK